MQRYEGQLDGIVFVRDDGKVMVTFARPWWDLAGWLWWFLCPWSKTRMWIQVFVNGAPAERVSVRALRVTYEALPFDTLSDLPKKERA